MKALEARDDWRACRTRLRQVRKILKAAEANPRTIVIGNFRELFEREEKALCDRMAVIEKMFKMK